ncbi:unnamed protein product [Auanema sp. JU1783]|nr:unnamed protein product [Auanema sp. JU1783]
MRSKHRKTLEELSLKINSLERRLSNARSARDAYIDYLRLKYPLWKPMISSYAGVPRKEEPSNPLECIWESVMTRNGNPPHSNNPMFNCYQTQKEVQELATQMRELQLRLAHSNTSSYPKSSEAVPAFHNNHVPPNFYAYEQSLKYPPMANMHDSPESKDDHLLNEMSVPRQNREPIVGQRTDPIIHNIEKETKHEEIIQERVVTFPSVAVEKTVDAPQVVQNQQNNRNNVRNSNSQIMNLLSKKVETSDDSDDDIDKGTSHPVDNRKPPNQSEPDKPADTKGSLSMYLKKIADNDSSSSDDIFAPVKRLGRMDSDSDFFG